MVVGGQCGEAHSISVNFRDTDGDELGEAVDAGFVRCTSPFRIFLDGYKKPRSLCRLRQVRTRHGYDRAPRIQQLLRSENILLLLQVLWCSYYRSRGPRPVFPLPAFCAAFCSAFWISGCVRTDAYACNVAASKIPRTRRYVRCGLLFDTKLLMKKEKVGKRASLSAIIPLNLRVMIAENSAV